MHKRIDTGKMMDIGMAIEKAGGGRYGETTLARFAFQQSISDYVNDPTHPDCPRPTTMGETPEAAARAILKEYVGEYTWKPETVALVVELLGEEAKWIESEARLESDALLEMIYQDVDALAARDVLSSMHAVWGRKPTSTRLADLDAAIEALTDLRKEVGRMPIVAADPTPRRLASWR